jgi:outer membrane protein OmpA-like peptidoglycan-associated protein
MKKLLLTFMLLGSLMVYCQEKFQVFFDFNKDTPTDKVTAEVQGWLQQNKNIEIVKLIGYCDSVDKSDYNKDLAMRRITTMLKLLKSNSIKINDAVQLQAIGKDFKLSKNQKDNRKVEIYYAPINIPTSKDSKKPIDSNYLKDSKETEASEEGKDTYNTLSALVAEEKSALEKKFVKGKIGDLIRINNINFYFNSEKLMEQSMPLLEELLQIMLKYPKLRIEINGHICCNPNPMDTKLSYRRALIIYKYLASHGIQNNRLAYKGIGSNQPIYPLPERTEAQRAANRRVEILIVDK